MILMDRVISMSYKLKIGSLIDAIAWLSSLLNRIAALCAAVILAAMTSLILLEIVLRTFGKSTYMADSLVAYGVSSITFLSLSWVLEKGAMLRVSSLTSIMPKWLQVFAHIFATISTLGMALFLINYQWSKVFLHFARGSTSQHYLPIPLWIPESIFLVGLLLLALHLSVRLMQIFSNKISSTDNTLNL